MKSKSIIKREKIQRDKKWQAFKERNYFTWFDLSPRNDNEIDSGNVFYFDFLP